ncbi:MAG: glycosyltransferase [Bacteroidetes bacterium]|nr:MAG: glycosyltransferase [Bacteroidota bacterium]
MAVKVSIIIPCYNQGHFLADAIKSIEATLCENYEVIIINDGSTDDFTNAYTKSLAEQGFNVIFQQNMGLAAARNAGVLQAKGQYILPLDADNKILKPYVEDAVKLLDADNRVAVVYGDAQIFGDKDELWEIGSYNQQRLMLHNYIDACALIRKSALESVGLYDAKNRLYGLEDWDLWLRLSFAGYGFSYLPMVCFCYRVHQQAMSKGGITQYKNVNQVEKVIHEKYPHHMGHGWIEKKFVGRLRKSPLQIMFKIVLIAYFPRVYSYLLKNNKIRNGI